MGNDRVFILLSGGIDSTTTFAMAKYDFPKLLPEQFEAVSIDYGQRHLKELDAAKQVADHYQASHKIVDAKGFMTGMLVGNDEAIPNVSYDELPEGISPTYVSFRNGLMLSILAARAQSWIMQEQQKDKEFFTGEAEAREAGEYNAYIYCGVHADDGANWAYPDCTPEFIGGMANAIFIGTYNRVRLRAPILNMPKAMVVQIGLGLEAPLHKTWSCYVGAEMHCGTCPTCRSRKDAFKLVGVKDPTRYAQ